MSPTHRLLIINPGSTSTKIAVFENETQVMEETLRHTDEELAPYATILDQYTFRKNVILTALEAQDIDLEELDAVVGRGGLLKPMEGGTYRVDERVLADLKSAVMGSHASNLGALIANEIAEQYQIPAYIVDPVVVDELEDLARISGMPEIQRISIVHALNQKAVARRAAKEAGKHYAEMNLIVAHLGGGISVGAHKKGRIVDVNNALGDGPFTPERTGGLPTDQLAKLCYSGQYTLEEMKKKLVGKGGLVAYLGTSDGREISRRIQEGDSYAEQIYQAMAYQVAKEIGAAAAVLEGDVDAILLTGGLAYDALLMGWIKKRVNFISPVILYPGEEEMKALAEGGLRVLSGEEQAKEYLG